MSPNMLALVASLREELASLEEELRADPRLLKVERIRSLLELYSESDESAHTGQLEPSSVSSRSDIDVDPPVNGPGKIEGSKAYQVRLKIREVLRRSGSSHRVKLLEALIEEGLMGREKNPIASLAAYLSEWRDEFGSDGKGIFYLKRGVNASNENGSEVEASDPRDVSLFRETSERR